MKQFEKVSKKELKEDIHQALKLWHKVNVIDIPLDYLCIFQQHYHQAGYNAHKAMNKVLEKALDALAGESAAAARLLRLHYLDGKVMYAVANELNIAESTANKKQRLALTLLTEKLLSFEQEARHQQKNILIKRLEPLTYTKLIGGETHLEKMLSLLRTPQAPWIISIEGIGGIGKTSLADALARRVIDTALFYDFGWVSARQQTFNLGGGIKPVTLPALTVESLVERLIVQLMPTIPRPDTLSDQEGLTILRDKLKQSPHLIVIDNLETITDLEALLPTLYTLSNPSKFLLTSRQSTHYQSGIYQFSLPPLSEADTLELVRYEADLKNLTYLQKATDKDLKKIYTVVGGNPLDKPPLKTEVLPNETFS